MTTLNATYTTQSLFTINYGRDLEAEIERLCLEINRYPALTDTYAARWLAVKLLEQDHDIQQKLLTMAGRRSRPHPRPNERRPSGPNLRRRCGRHHRRPPL
ncbi:MAG: hypothetical protein M5U34_13595 [Chloroflexi bacterium]|nr:hypothetical protein [Chloroflexota bacterium]